MFVKRRGLKYKFVFGSVAAIVVATVSTTALLLALIGSSPEHTVTYLLIASVFYIVTGLALVLYLSRIMVLPVITLTEKVHEIRSGNFDVSLDNKSSGDEMGELFEGFNEMVKDLKTSISELRSEKEKAELYSRQLYESKAKLEAIFNGISDGIMVIDRDLRIVAANPFFEKIMGHPPAELAGNYCYEMCHEGSSICQGCNAVATFESGQYLSGIRTVVARSGDKRFFDVHNFPLKDENGQVQQVIEYVKEVTSLIRTREKLEQTRRLAELGELAAKVAHEVRNPLNAIEGAIHYLINEFQSDSKVTTFGTLIRDQVARLNKVTSDLLNYAKPMTADLVPGQVVPVVQRALSIVKPHLDAKGIQVRYTHPEALPSIPIDSGQLEQAIINLVVNAADAMSYCGQLTVGVKVLESPSNGIDEGIQVAVMDDGCGMDDRVRKMMFSPFFTTKEKGTGLGLSIVSRVVANHEGSMEVQSSEGKGTTVIINLPLRRELEIA